MNRRHTFCAAVACFASVLGGAAPTLAQSKAKAENIPEIPYDSVPNFFKLPPNIAWTMNAQSILCGLYELCGSKF
jgi:hypothetical protein